MIEGVSIIDLKQIGNENGKVMHMIRNDTKNFTKFGEIYFSTVLHDKVFQQFFMTKLKDGIATKN